MRVQLFGLICLSLLSGLGACTEEQRGELRIEGLTIEECETEDPLIINLDFVAFDACDDILFLRMQKSGRLASVSDGVALQIEDLTKFRQQLKSGPVEVPLPDGAIRLAPYLNDTCAASFASLQAQQGTLRIQELTPEDGGSLLLDAEFIIVDARTGETVSTAATLTMDAVLSVETPHKLYMTCP